ncbi:ATP-grasp domain-containing protein [Rubrolithibacter danxiaensis]|uniref:ATP-grasp domain-containing protein n=1 Tax=Rubrolithibacter danxiaensis TaxID=3390805 RepID=UPI003BF8159C
MNILLTCAGRRNYLVNYFKEALRGSGKVIATDVQLNAPALVDADIAFKVPSIYDETYISNLLSICKENNVKALVSLNDLELPIIAANKSLFAEVGVTAIVSDTSVIDICFDKWNTKKFLDSIGVNAPQTYITLSDALDAIHNQEVRFPLIIKPRWGSASIGIECVENEEELKLTYKLLSLRLNRTILGEVSKNSINQAILIQERLSGQEYGMDVFNDLNGNYIASFAKKKLAMRDGETDKAQTVSDERFHVLGAKLGKGLKHLGNLDCDVFETSKGLYILELNPRFGGGYPFTHESGVNIPGALVKMLSGNQDITKYMNISSGKAFAKCDRMVEIPVEP